MSKVLSEFFKEVQSSDIADYGYGETKDFLTHPFSAGDFDWIITNPPFKLGEEFVLRSLSLARTGVAILVRTVFLESIGRYKNLFLKQPPSLFAQFSERVPIVKGRLEKSATTATGYGWLIWRKEAPAAETRLIWIPPCRKAFERPNDYEVPATPRQQTRLF